MKTIFLEHPNQKFSIYAIEDDDKSIWIHLGHTKGSIGLTDEDEATLRFNYPEKISWERRRNYNYYTENGYGSGTFIEEPAFIALTLYSNKPDALEYLFWVTDEVCSKLRKTGKYFYQNDTSSDASHYLSEKKYKEYIQLQNYLEHNQHKIDFANLVESSSGSKTVEEFAHLLHNVKTCRVGKIKLHQWLRDKGYFRLTTHRKNLPYQRYIDCGYFEIKYPGVEIHTKDGFVGDKWHSPKYGVAHITPKGQVALAQHICNDFRPKDQQECSLDNYLVPIEVIIEHAEELRIPDDGDKFLPMPFN